MTFLVAIHKDPQSCYGVSVPDLPGCISAGDTLAEALAMAKEAITLHLEGMLDDGAMIPEVSTDIDRLKNDPEYADVALWAAVDVALEWKRSPTNAA